MGRVVSCPTTRIQSHPPFCCQTYASSLLTIHFQGVVHLLRHQEGGGVRGLVTLGDGGGGVRGSGDVTSEIDPESANQEAPMSPETESSDVHRHSCPNMP